ncbi:MAG: PDZ domain-containing protein [Clostridiales bacterium]|nr:PDZ domain-containing protein [Clostridiales bacterium]
MKKLRLILCLLIAVLLCAAYPVQAYAETTDEQVYIGGFQVGIALDVGGALVEEVTGVNTEYGVAKVDGIQKGDIITKVNGGQIKSVDDIREYLTAERAEIELLRSGKNITVTVVPIIEQYTNSPRLGIKIKDKIYGIGTVTYVDKNGGYAALGHEIYDAETDTHFIGATGKLHACKILGIKKSVKDEAGAILASIVGDSDYGTITCSNNFGIAGKYTAEIPSTDMAYISSKSEIKPGAAQIRTSIDGNPKYYDIEIVKASTKGVRREKSIVFRVTDKELIDKTGGILRGMSGSPILQNGKLVGAVTHVFLNDPTRGYGLAVEHMNKN